MLSPVQQTLLPEILGFSPQLLVDDLINVGYDNIAQAVEALEAFLDANWLSGRSEEDHAKAQAGLVSFQTLLQSHANKAFDAFEMWSLKNVFAIPDPSEYPIVLPHHRGLDLTATEENEKKLTKDIELLRKKVDAHKRLQARLRLAVRLSNARTARSQARLEQLRFLSTVKDTTTLPEEVQQLLERVSALPSIPPAVDPSVAFQDPTKPAWHTHAGYVNWAVNKTLERHTSKEHSETMKDVEDEMADTGKVEDLVRLKETLDTQP